MPSSELIRRTQSLCPECLQVIDAEIRREGDLVVLWKECPEHGEFDDIYWSDYQLYRWAEQYYAEGAGIENPRTQRALGCPYDCGICPEHKSRTVLGIIDVTNRCNLRCPICFANAAAVGYLYEPSFQEVVEMLRNLRANRPVPVPALQFSGGEPTVREDLPKLVRAAKELGFRHVEVNTNGLRLAESVEYCRELKEAGTDTIYLQFDGVSDDIYQTTRGRALFKVKEEAIENLREAGFRSVVLVPTVCRGVNDHQIGDILRFALQHADVVRGVNFQPVSITGRIDRQQRRKLRYTIPDLMKDVERQFGHVRTTDFFPVPAATIIVRFLEAFKRRAFVDFTAHPHCGIATYLFKEGEDWVPITEVADVEAVLEALRKATETLRSGKRVRGILQALVSARYIKGSLARKLVRAVFSSASYKDLGAFHYNAILIGCMHFMDPYNFDLARVQHCCIHYAVPDGRIIPFCSMNSIHRPSVEKKFAHPLPLAAA